MNQTELFSVPRTLNIPNVWQETPRLENRVNQTAKTYFIEWKDQSLSAAKICAEISSVVSAAGLALTCLFVAPLGILVSGVTLTISIIAYRTFQPELLNRCRSACFRLEDWLIGYKHSCEQLHNILETYVNFADSKSLAHSLKYDPNFLPDDDFQKLKTNLARIIENFPANDFQQLSDDLIKQHQMLFGNQRSIGDSYWSDDWLKDTSSIGAALNGFFKANINQLQEYFSKDSNNKSKNEFVALAWHTLNSLRKVIQEPKTEEQKAKLQQLQVLRGYSHAQAQQGFCEGLTMIGLIEVWRKNIAIFRNSIK